MSIEFSCPGCDNEMEVNDNMAGQKGKCPKCGRLITVPQRSSREMIFASEEQGYFRSKRLNNLFVQFLEEYSDEIRNCDFVDASEDAEGAIVEVYTKGGRTQIVSIINSVIDGEEILIGRSVIGRHSEYLGFNDILIDMALHLPMYPTYAVFIEKNNRGMNEIGLRKVTRLEHVDEQSFYHFTIRLARFADIVEATHYTNDAN